MKFKDEIMNNLYAQILMGKLREVSSKIRSESLSVPLEILQMGYERSKYQKIGGSHQESLGRPDSSWVDCMGFSKDPLVADYLETIIGTSPYFTSKAILNLWKIAPERGISIMKTLEVCDPEFESIRLLTRKELIVNEKQLRNNEYTKVQYQKLASGDLDGTHILKYLLLISEEKNSPKILKAFNDVLQTSEEIRENFNGDRRKLDMELKRNRDRRSILITEALLTNDQYNKLFLKLWEHNTNIKQTNLPLNQRDAWNLFNYPDRQREISTYGYKDRYEVMQLLILLEKISIDVKPYVNQMFNTLPFWTEEYRSVEQAMHRFDPNKVISDWKEVLNLDSHVHQQETIDTHAIMSWEKHNNHQGRHMGAKARSRASKSARINTNNSNIDSQAIFNYPLTESEFFYGLNRIKDQLTRDYLFELIDHDNPNIRGTIKKILQENVKSIPQSLTLILQELDSSFDNWNANPAKKKN